MCRVYTVALVDYDTATDHKLHAVAILKSIPHSIDYCDNNDPVLVIGQLGWQLHNQELKYHIDTTLIVSADIPPLEVRHNRNKLLFVYKVLYKLTNMPNHLFTPLSSRKSIRFNHSLSLTPYAGNTNRYMYSAIPSMIKLWNTLPFNPSECTSIAHFKYTLNHHQS